MPQGATVIKDGIRIVKGTPAAPITRSTLFLRMWRVVPRAEGDVERTFASLHVVRPGRGGYVVKELLAAAELEPNAALDQAVAIARRGDVAEICVNADLAKLTPAHAATA